MLTDTEIANEIMRAQLLRAILAELKQALAELKAGTEGAKVRWDRTVRRLKREHPEWP